MCWITGGHPTRRLLLPTDIELKPSQNLASKVTGLQAHVTTPSYFWPGEVLKLRETRSN